MFGLCVRSCKPSVVGTLLAGEESIVLLWGLSFSRWRCWSVGFAEYSWWKPAFLFNNILRVRSRNKIEIYCFTWGLLSLTSNCIWSFMSLWSRSVRFCRCCLRLQESSLFNVRLGRFSVFLHFSQSCLWVPPLLLVLGWQPQVAGRKLHNCYLPRAARSEAFKGCHALSLPVWWHSLHQSSSPVLVLLVLLSSSLGRTLRPAVWFSVFLLLWFSSC